MMRVSTWLPVPVAVFATASLGAVLGYASGVVYVIGLGAIALGLTAAAAVSVVALMASGRTYLTASRAVATASMLVYSATPRSSKSRLRLFSPSSSGPSPSAALGLRCHLATFLRPR